MALWSNIASQFRNPTGYLGKLAGFIMVHRKSNVERNTWAVNVLDLKPDDNVLEIGFGPGVAIQRMSEIVTRGVVYGVDHSQVMLSQATKRNQKGIASGRVRLSLCSVSTLPSFDNALDKVLDINSFQFWEHQVDSLMNLRKHMTKGGIIAIVHQPRRPGATDDETEMAGKRFLKALQESGFEEITMEKRIMKPVSVVCLRGINR